MKKAFAAVAMAAATLSIASLAVATATSPSTWTPQSRQAFSTFAVPAIGALDASTATQSPSAPTADPTGSVPPTNGASQIGSIDRPTAPTLPAAAVGRTTTVVVIATPRPKPKPAPVVTQPKTTVYTPTVASAKAYALARIGSVQYSCLYQLWMRESGWNPYALNRSSGAYGIPQALPGTKMATAGADWRTNPVTQVKWGLGYVAHYGGACAAWSFWRSHGWY